MCINKYSIELYYSAEVDALFILRKMKGTILGNVAMKRDSVMIDRKILEDFKNFDYKKYFTNGND